VFVRLIDVVMEGSVNIWGKRDVGQRMRGCEILLNTIGREEIYEVAFRRRIVALCGSLGF